MTTHRTPTLPAACTGDCDAGSRDCTFGRAIGMWDQEKAHPWRAALLYGSAVALSLLASALWPWGVA